MSYVRVFTVVPAVAIVALASAMSWLAASGGAQTEVLPEGTRVPKVDGETASLELVLLEMVEVLRRRENLPPLERDFAIGLVARDYSRAMLAVGDVQHDLRGPLVERIRAVAPESCLFGENLARHFDVTEVLAGWLESAGHRRNLLNPEFDRSGIGIVRGSDRILYVTHLFAGPCDGDVRRHDGDRSNRPSK